MPLTHFLSKSGQRITFEDAIAHALRTPGSYTASVLAAMAAGSDRTHAGISATMLGGCARKSYFDMTREYGVHPDKLWAALRGTAMHSVFERVLVPGIRAEERIARQTDSGIWITGKPDCIEIVSGRLYDYKSKDVVPKSVDNSYVWQTNTYAWLYEQPYHAETHEPLPPQDISELYIIFFTMRSIEQPRQVRRWQPGEWENRVQPVAESIQGALDGGPWPKRKFANPQTSIFCLDYCPHVRECLIRP